MAAKDIVSEKHESPQKDWVSFLEARFRFVPTGQAWRTYWTRVIKEALRASGSAAKIKLPQFRRPHLEVDKQIRLAEVLEGKPIPPHELARQLKVFEHDCTLFLDGERGQITINLPDAPQPFFWDTPQPAPWQWEKFTAEKPHQATAANLVELVKFLFRKDDEVREELIASNNLHVWGRPEVRDDFVRVHPDQWRRCQVRLDCATFERDKQGRLISHVDAQHQNKPAFLSLHLAPARLSAVDDSDVKKPADVPNGVIAKASSGDRRKRPDEDRIKRIIFQEWEPRKRSGLTREALVRLVSDRLIDERRPPSPGTIRSYIDALKIF